MLSTQGFDKFVKTEILTQHKSQITPQHHNTSAFDRDIWCHLLICLHAVFSLNIVKKLKSLNDEGIFFNLSREFKK